MSKILRRPMFRGGGTVSSYGNGIATGLADGGMAGKRGLVDGPGGYAGEKPKFITGGDLLDLNTQNFSAGLPFSYDKALPLNSSEKINGVEEVPKGEVDTDDRSFIQKTYEFFNPTKETIENRLQESSDNMTTFDEKLSSIGITTNRAAEENKNKELIASLQDLSGNDLPPSLRNPNKDNTDNQSTLDSLLNNNNEESTEMSVDDIKAQAQIFKDLLNEGNNKKLKSARISDASDYLLKFFEGSQKEGATVGSSAADVAGFATSKDSKTEKAKAGIDKTDQTATVMAINDYVSGKKSKAEIEKLMGLAKYKDKLLGQRSKKNVGEYIMASNQVGFSGKVKEGVQAKYGPKSFEEILSTDLENFKFGDSDIGKIFIETDTQKVYTFDEKGNTIPIYQG